MNQAAFADLCGVSAAMVSKYGVHGRLTYRGRQVDAAESLKALEGHLDETKRLAAVKALAELEAKAPPTLLDVIPGGRESDPTGEGDPAAPTGWREMFQAKEAELSYHERVGNLIDASEISQALESVIANFWSETERNLKLEAAEIASDLALSGDQAAKLKKLMAFQNRKLRADFAESCRRASDDSSTLYRR